MKSKHLNTSQNLPIIGLGTSGLKGEECTRAIESALDLGYTHIDTAEMYDNEEAIGTAIQHAGREGLFITSKVWRERPLTYDDVLESCDKSLKRLGTQYLDLYLIHWPQRGTDYANVLKAFRELQGQGLIRAIGVSNFTISHLRESMEICESLGIQIAVNQVEFHPGLYQRELLEFCNEKGIVLTAYTPLSKGNLDDAVLNEIGKHHNKSAAQVSLRWLLQKGLVSIPKSSQRAHQQANLEVFDFELRRDEMAQIDALGSDQRLVRPGWAEFEDA